MASKQGELQYILIDDFSPGIYADRGVSTIQPAPKGAAQLTNTFSCISTEDGALTGAPGRTDGYFENSANFEATWSPTNDRLGSSIGIRVIAMRNISPVYLVGTPGQTAYYPDQLFLMFQYYYDPTHAGHNYSLRGRGRSYKIFTDASTQHFLSGSPGTYNFFTQTDAVGYNASITNNPVILYGSAGIDLTRSDRTTPTNPGMPIAFGSYYPAYTQTGTSGSWTFPSNATPTVDSTQTLTFNNLNGRLGTVFAHQDRVVGMGALQNNYVQVQFGTNGVVDGSDWIEFLNVNNPSISSGSLVINSENPSGYGSWKSMNASTLMLVKRQQGGVIVSGPLEQPNVTKMPGIPGTDQYANIGCLGPDGSFIYGTGNGVYSWNGGNTARLISPQLSSNFWINTSDYNNYVMTGPRASFAATEDWLFAPNNFIYNFRSGSWWRLQQPNSLPNSQEQTYTWYDNSTSGEVIAVPNCILAQAAAGNDTNPTYSYFDPATTQNIWSWQSQPFAEGVNRELAVRELNMTYTGGPFTVTLTGLNNTTQAETFPINSSTTPKTLSLPTYVDAWDSMARIQCTSGGGYVYRLSLGYYEEETAR